MGCCTQRHAGSCCSEAAFRNLHHLERLQSLVLGWAQLPRPVVSGCEAWCLTGTTLDSTTMPGLSKLTALRKLVVAGSVEAVDPVLLAGLPAALQHLRLDDVRLVMTLGQVSVHVRTQTTVTSPAILMPAVSAARWHSQAGLYLGRFPYACLPCVSVDVAVRVVSVPPLSLVAAIHCCSAAAAATVTATALATTAAAPRCVGGFPAADAPEHQQQAWPTGLPVP